ncbi:MAG: outer membrane beta-barrel protein [Hyphomicrobiales bacterium]
MKSVSTRSRVVRTASLLVLALSLAVSARAQEVDDLRLAASQDNGDDTMVDAPPPPPAELATISSADDPVPTKRKRTAALRPYDPTGLRLGAFTLLPTLEVNAVADSNVARASSGAKQDVGIGLKPGFALQSNWQRHELTAKASAEMLHYLDNSDLSSKAANALVHLRLDARRDLTADLETSYALTSEGASDSEVPDTAIGNRTTQTFGGSLAVTHDGGIVAVSGRAGATHSIYSNVALSGGGTEDNSDRNYTEYELALRGSVSTGSALKPFAEVAYVPRIHDQKIDRNGLARDSNGYRLKAGVTFDDDPVWSGEVAGIYLIRDYDDASLKTTQAPGLSASLVWRPTEIDRVDLTSDVSLGETATAGESATRSWSSGLTVTHALRDNLDLSAGVTAEFSRSSGATDTSYGTRLAATWAFNPELAATLAYEGTYYRPFASSGDYDDHRLLASIILRR